MPLYDIRDKFASDDSNDDGLIFRKLGCRSTGNDAITHLAPSW
jgi:hypothetical protein